MALHPSSWVWQETEYVIPAGYRSINATSPSDRHAAPQTPHSSLFSFTLQSVGGTCWLPQRHAGTASTAAGVTWQIENGSAGKLSLVESSEAVGHEPQQLVIQFRSQLFPGAVLVAGPTGAHAIIVGITADGCLWAVDLPNLDSQPSCLSQVQEQHIRFVDISSQWAALGSPTQLACTSDHVLIGGSQGPVLCLAAHALLDAAASQGLAMELSSAHGQSGSSKAAFLLRESSWGIKSLIAGVWQRTRSPSVVSLMHMPAPRSAADKAGQLLVLYDDCTIRGFSLTRQSHVFSDTLSCCQYNKRQMAIFGSLAPLADPSSPAASQAVIVVQLESADTLTRSVHAVVLGSTSPGSKLSQTHQLQLASEPTASILSVHTQDAAVWVLYRQGDGSSTLLRYSLTGSGQASGMASLLDSRLLPAPSGSSRKAGAGVCDAMTLDIWEDLLSLAPQPSPASATPAVELAAREVLARILQPGLMYRDVLHAVLRHLGISATLVEVNSATTTKLHTLLSSAVDALQRRSSGWSRARCWAQLLASYQELWCKLHPALGLSASPHSPDQVDIVRGGGVRAVLRAAAVQEALAVPVAAHPEPLVTLPAPVAAVHQAAQQVSALLGPWAQDASLALLAAGTPPLTGLAPALMRLVLEGGSHTGYADDLSQEQRSAWRLTRQRTLLAVSATLSKLPDCLIAIREYCHVLSLAPASLHLPAPPQPSSSPLPHALTTCLSQAARQLAAAQAAACRDMLLLVTLLANQRLVGMPSLPASTTITLSTTILPQLCDLLRRSAMVLWLTITPTTSNNLGQPRPRSDAAVNGIASLQLGSPGLAPLPPAPPQESSTSSKRSSLLSTLLPALVSSKQSSQAVALREADRLVKSVAMSIQYGPIGGIGLIDSVSVDLIPSVEDQGLQLAYTMFTAGEYTAVEGLTQLVMGGSAGPGIVQGDGQEVQGDAGVGGAAGMHLLHGLSTACSLQGVSKATRTLMVSQAAECFFKTATALNAGGSPLLVHILQQLTSSMTGCAVTPLTTPLSPAQASALQLQMYEVAMQVFEREQAPEGALRCAWAAVQHCNSSRGGSTGQAADSNSMELDGAGGDGSRGARRNQPGGGEYDTAWKGRLWSSIFRYCCQLQAWSDAYAALVCNPDPQQADSCLMRLVHELSQAGELAVLCSLPLVGVLQLPTQPGSTGAGAGQQAGSTLVTLRGVVQAALQRRAINSDLSAQPQPYRILYAFLVSRSEYREATAAMLAYAWRLRREGPRGQDTLQHILMAYDLAVACLSLVPPAEAWLDTSSPFLAAHSLETSTPSQLFDAGGEAARARLQGVGCLTLSQLKQEVAVVRGAVHLAQADGTASVDSLHHSLRPDVVLTQLLLAGHWAQAEELVEGAWVAGSAGAQAALQQLVTALADAAARTQIQGSSLLPQPLSLLSQDPQQQQLLLGCTHMASPAALLWNKLRLVLDAHLGPGSSGGGGAGQQCKSMAVGDTLRVAAADAVLRVDRRMALPMWLLQLFMERAGGGVESGAGWGMAAAGCGPAALLDLYLTHHRLSDATSLVVTQLDAWGKTDPRQRQGHAAAWFPHTRIQALREQLMRDVEHGKSGAAELLRELEGGLSRHAYLLDQDSAVLEQLRLQG